MPKKTITNVRKSCDICKSMGNIFCFLTFRTGGGHRSPSVPTSLERQGRSVKFRLFNERLRLEVKDYRFWFLGGMRWV